MRNTILIQLLFIFASLFIQKSNAVANNSEFIGSQKLYYGAAYYPEVWDESEIDKDIVRMKDLKMNVMRIGEFAWSRMEPKEGRYDFAWLHRVIEKLHANGIDVILGTPTATPPIWLAEKHPQIFQLSENGLHKVHGGRRNCSYTSKVYRDYSRKICERMVQEFGNKAGVIGWQTDNEFALSHDYSKETKKHWVQWLKKRYLTIDNLNQLWCTDLWSQTYQKFEQIPMPVSYIWHHPSLRLAWTRFTNDMIVEYQDIQLKAIRKFSNIPITHDGMPGQPVDYEKLFKNLDFASINNYHSFEAYDLIQSNYDRMRGHAKGYHWLFETAPNYSGGGEKGNIWYLHQIPGSMRAALWMHYASGGQGAMFWLWRQHRAGQEMPHGSVLSAWGAKTANYDELQTLGNELAKTSDLLMQHPVSPALIGILYSHEADNGLRIEEYANGVKYYNDWTYRFYRALADAYLFRDVIYPSSDFEKYKMLFLPLLPNINNDLQLRLQKWVEAGGTLILGPMSGYRNEEWAQHTDAFMGKIESWSGISVKSFLPIGTARRTEEIPSGLIFQPDLFITSAEASLWSLALSSKNGKTIATYEGGIHNNQSAIIENKVGKGKVLLLGTDPGKAALKKILLHTAKSIGIEPLATGDEKVVIVPRKNNIRIIVNLSKNAKSIQLNSSAYSLRNLLNDSTISTTNLKLKPFEVLILKDE
jgi:beta-galactosidase